MKLSVCWAQFSAAGGRAPRPGVLCFQETLHSVPCLGPRHSLELTVINQVLCVGKVEHLVPLGQRLH